MDLAVHKDFKVNGSTMDEFLGQTFQDDVLAGIQRLVLDWNEQAEFVFQTSGTTGKAKTILFDKTSIKTSCKITHEHLHLSAGINAWLALPLQYVAGKMMVYRAMVNGYNLWVSSATITLESLKRLPEKIHFAALVPLQVRKILEMSPEWIETIDHLIIGGAALDRGLHQGLKSLGNNIYETYGATETLTHVAMKRVGGDVFKAVGINHFSLKGELLVIHAPHISSQPLYTNDRVTLISATEFKWLGRADHVINSGGIKIAPERVEYILSKYIEQPFFIAGIKDDLLGEKVVLVVEANEPITLDWEQMNLTQYEIPKAMYCLPQFVRTTSGKIQRSETMELLHS